ncbi:hypothetical protein HPB52_011834 [Rhipicephalus sanguineus]|uniref:Uncharacterized protein n=1 Tax=Rhipicephalus sanguineus TaxID=34632 RepID=A0A9D4PIJ4_RHISA|nr:hypothetical protein HPB52_011834 [Rhipicephalus sanguineus]
MEVTVDGEDIHPDLVSEDLGWQQAVSRRSAKRSETALTDVNGTLGPESCMDVARNGGNRAAQLKGKLLKAGRTPRLPKEEAKVIVRPRGVLNITRMGAPLYEISTYEAAPHNTCKGVIRGIPIEDSLAEVERRIINSKNPLSLEAKRIKDTAR